MTLLFDENLSFRLCDLLADLFPNSLHVRDAGLASAPDQIWLRTGNQPARHTAEQLRTHVAAIQAFEAEPEAACLEIY
jgi:predicted nuclease of predicted toxin-antitoxin system